MVWTCDEESDEDWVKKCMEFRVEGRRPVGRSRRTWLESVEADMAEPELDKEDVLLLILFTPMWDISPQKTCTIHCGFDDSWFSGIELSLLWPNHSMEEHFMEEFDLTIHYSIAPDQLVLGQITRPPQHCCR